IRAHHRARPRSATGSPGATARAPRARARPASRGRGPREWPWVWRVRSVSLPASFARDSQLIALIEERFPLAGIPLDLVQVKEHGHRRVDGAARGPSRAVRVAVPLDLELVRGIHEPGRAIGNDGA